ncbi:hypothetical protein [Sphingobacterium suaedae]|uniref:Uncharacterized protein n=1 Tax=Sphingobacterium suaedae TaxID=1686402 RepID=A0ABW5KGQ7_9SPHI
METDFNYRDEETALDYLRHHVIDLYGSTANVVVRYDDVNDVLWAMKYFWEPISTAHVISVTFVGCFIDETGPTHFGTYGEESVNKEATSLEDLAISKLAMFVNDAHVQSVIGRLRR